MKDHQAGRNHDACVDFCQSCAVLYGGVEPNDICTLEGLGFRIYDKEALWVPLQWIADPGEPASRR